MIEKKPEEKVREYLWKMNEKFEKTMAPEMKEAVRESCLALSYRIPEKPEIEGDGYAENEDGEMAIVYDTWYCPNCGESYEYPDDQHRFCPRCGQAIDWDSLNEPTEASGGDE